MSSKSPLYLTPNTVKNSSPVKVLRNYALPKPVVIPFSTNPDLVITRKTSKSPISRTTSPNLNTPKK
jgi:hypothetical protein